MYNAGMRKPGSTIRIPVNTFDSNDPAASVTATTWLNTDCHVHKDGSTTQRASSSGETLTIDYDTVTGNHYLSIDTSDNTTAGFYAAGSHYDVRIEGVTVDAGNVNAWIGSFDLGYEDAILNTTIATLASQTSFTLTAGSADNDAYNGCPVIVHDVASAVQICIGVVSDYVGSTKTVTLAADPGIFTMAATDNISILPPSNTKWVGTTAQTAGDVPALITTVDTVVDGIQTDLDNGTDGLGAIKTDTAAILTDTGTTLDNHLTDIKGTGFVKDTHSLIDIETYVDILDDATSGNAKIATDAAAILVDTNSLNDTKIPDTISLANINAEVDTALATTTYAEPGQGAPAATASLKDKIGYLYKAWRNKIEQTATTMSIYDDAGTTVDQKATVSDDATTAAKSEIVSGP